MQWANFVIINSWDLSPAAKQKERDCSLKKGQDLQSITAEPVFLQGDAGYHVST